MTARHGLHDIERFTAADLADNHSIRAQTQGCSEQVADRHRPPPAWIRRARLELNHVWLLELNLAGILDDDDALRFRNEAGERVEQRSLSTSSAACHDNIGLGNDERAQSFGCHGRQAFELDEPVDGQRFAKESPNCNARTIGESRWNDGFQTRTVRQSTFKNRMLLVNQFSDELRDIAQCREQRIPARKAGLNAFQTSTSLDINLIGTVDHDLAHTRIFEERADRSKVREHRLLID